MKYILTKGEQSKQANVLYQFGLLIKLGLKFTKLLKLSH